MENFVDNGFPVSSERPCYRSALCIRRPVGKAAGGMSVDPGFSVPDGLLCTSPLESSPS
jgi:hypothetical protein